MWFGIYYEEKGEVKGILLRASSKKKLVQKLNCVLNDRMKLKEVRVNGNLYTAEEFYHVLNGQGDENEQMS